MRPTLSNGVLLTLEQQQSDCTGQYDPSYQLRRDLFVHFYSLSRTLCMFLELNFVCRSAARLRGLLIDSRNRNFDGHCLSEPPRCPLLRRAQHLCRRRTGDAVTLNTSPISVHAARYKETRPGRIYTNGAI